MVCYLLSKKKFFINLLVCNLFVYLHSENKPKNSYKIRCFLCLWEQVAVWGIYIIV